MSTPGATQPGADDLAVTGVPAIDAALGGGLRRGHLSEIVGGRSSGRTAAVCRALGAAVSRGELVALVDTCDRFDPESAAATGLDLSRLLWIRETGDATRALKAMNLVLQAGGFGLVVLDLADVPRPVGSRAAVHDLVSPGAGDRRQPDGGGDWWRPNIWRAVPAARRSRWRRRTRHAMRRAGV